ncbi:MAG: tetratricopeptide repeat protein [Pirellulaceae bacterium]
MANRQPDLHEIFNDALDRKTDEERSRYLDEACRDAPEKRARVEALLLADSDPQNLLAAISPGIAATIDFPPIELPGTQIGPYKLLEQIGEGGMGIVYVASQKEPLRRKVALKIIKPGMDTREVVARFEAERQALALMDHPNIAKVFDAGATDAGRPYFAMELVQGTPITEYCDHAQLSTRERLELFVTLCHGVQHAHQKGVIHRDLKPSNLLVEVHDVRPVPKIIDFGIAKAVGQQLTEKTFHTAQSQMVGTPLYMSPEQAGQSNKDVDTRSDIYSLGVLLYELLTGSTPFEKDTLRTAGFDELRRIIREVEPPRPSARVSTLQAADLSTVCDRRNVEPHKLSQQLRGDLDWIVMKAMDKDRERRYTSATALATDVQRYLDDEPVQARPPSLLHHAAKWVRRHRPLVWSSAVVLALAALAGGALFATNYRRTSLLKRDAGEHLAAAIAFLGSGNYTAADRELADARGHLEAASYGTGPLADTVTDLTVTIAAKTQSIGDFEQFQELRHRIHSEMYALDRTILDQAQAHCRTALDLFGVFAAEPWESQADFEILDTARQSLLDEGAVELLFVWARLEMGKSEALSAAERNAGYRRAIEALGKIEKSHPSITAVALWMADCWEAVGDHAAAAEARVRAESLQPASAADYYLLGEYHAQHGQQDQALASYWQALTQQPDHYLSLLAAGVALGELRKYESAETMLTGAIAMYPQITLGYVKRGASRLGQGKILLAQADFQEAVKLDPELAAALIRRAGDYWVNLELDKALADLDEAIRLDPKSTWAYTQRSLAYFTQGDMDKAIADSNAAIQLDAKYSVAYARRAAAYWGKDELDNALADSNEAIRLDPTFSGGYFQRGVVYGTKGELDKALADLNEAMRLDPNAASGVLASRAYVYQCRGEYDKALADCDEAIRLSPKNFWAYFVRAAVHEARGDVEKALAECSQAIGLNRDIPWGYATRGRILQAQGDLDKALADYSEAIRLAPKAAGAYVERGGAYVAKGDSDKALADCNEVIRLDPKNGNPYAQRGCVYLDMRKFEKAAAEFDRAAELGPIGYHYYKRRAAAHFELRHYDKALESIAKAVELNPGDGSNLLWIDPKEVAKCPDERLRQGLQELADKALENSQGTPGVFRARGFVRLAFGRQEEALADFDKVIELEPKNPAAWAERACLYVDLGQWEKAIADFSKLLELQPEQTGVWYQRSLARLGGGQANEYRQDCGELLQRLGSTDSVNDAYFVAWTCALAPDATKDWATAVALAEKVAMVEKTV